MPSLLSRIRLPADPPLWQPALLGVESPPLDGALAADVAILGAGFTGLSAAYFLKRADPALRVVVLERERVGSGASGRCAGLLGTRLGLGLRANVTLFGRTRAKQAHLYMEQAVELVERLVRQNRIDCDYERTGSLRLATSAALARSVREEVELAQRMNLQGVEWLEREAARRELETPAAFGAWSEPRAAVLNPAKLLRGMRAAVEAMGVAIFERTEAQLVQRKLGRFFVRTPKGGVLVEKLAVALNAFPGPVAGLERRQAPALLHAVATEPLSPQRLERLGWPRRQWFEDARRFPHFYRLTPDGRLIVGGGLGLAVGRDLSPGLSRRIVAALEAEALTLFPSLRGVRFTHRWHGPISVPVSPAPAVGLTQNKRVAYAFGCVGHGLALAHMNGWTLADLLREERTERTEAFFVNRRLLQWPPAPIRQAVGLAAAGLLEAHEIARARGLLRRDRTPEELMAADDADAKLSGRSVVRSASQG